MGGPGGISPEPGPDPLVHLVKSLGGRMVAAATFTGALLGGSFDEPMDEPAFANLAVALASMAMRQATVAGLSRPCRMKIPSGDEGLFIAWSDRVVLALVAPDDGGEEVFEQLERTLRSMGGGPLRRPGGGIS